MLRWGFPRAWNQKQKPGRCGRQSATTLSLTDTMTNNAQLSTEDNALVAFSDMEKITDSEALRQGFRPMTIVYRQKERWMLDNVISDMKRGKITYVLVQAADGVEVWRK